MEPLNLNEFEAVAREILPRNAYDYYAGGSDDEITLAENRDAFARRSLKYRVLVDVAERDLSTRLLDGILPHPIILAPTALHKMAHPDGEVATARGAEAAGALQCVSTISTVPLEQVMEAAPQSPKWFQLYVYSDRAVTESLVKRAYAAGYRAIVLTVDLPVLGRRERDFRNVFTIPDGITLANFAAPPPRPEGGSALASWASDLSTHSLTWKDIDWLRSLSPLPIILKGIVRADDAIRAADSGIEAIWVSNHGGRQLDTSVATIDALEEIAEATEGRVPLIMDGGVRRGTDVLKAIALGASAVAIGRPQLWGLAAGGAAGVERAVDLLREELSVAMALAGCPSLSDITPDLIA